MAQASFEERALELINSTVSSGRPISECMATLAGYCAEVAPDPSWNQIGNLDLGLSQRLLEDWLRGTLTASRPADEIRAYYFGLFTAMVGGRETIELYVSGSDEYDADDSDWACEPAYFPDTRYAPPEVMAQLCRSLPANQPSRSVGEYVLCLGYACLAARDLMRALDRSLLLGNADERMVAVGFDEGDVVTIGKLVRNGFVCAEANS